MSLFAAFVLFFALIFSFAVGIGTIIAGAFGHEVDIGFSVPIMIAGVLALFVLKTYEQEKR